MSSEMTDIEYILVEAKFGIRKDDELDGVPLTDTPAVKYAIKQFLESDFARRMLVLITSQKAIGEKEAEQRGVAWSIACIDQMHLVEEQTDTATDKIYKGIKNCLRDSYKAVAGVDPAPSYPIKVTIHQLSTEDVKDEL